MSRLRGLVGCATILPVSQHNLETRMATKAFLRILLMGLVGSFFFLPSPRAADQRPVVAVFDVQTKFLKLSKVKQDMLTELLGQELGVGGVYQVMPPGDVKRALLEQSSESFKACYDEKCQIDLGRQLPANKLVTTTVMKLGGKCRVSASLYDLKRQTTDLVAKEKVACDEVALAGAVERVAAKLRDWTGDTATRVELPRETRNAQATAPAGDKDYKQALNKAWRELARKVRSGSDEEKLERYQTFLADYPSDNPHAYKVQANIDALEAMLDKLAAAGRTAEEKKVALETQRKLAQEMKAAYNAAKAKKGSAGERLAAWERFLVNFSEDNPYVKTAQRKIDGLRVQAKREGPSEKSGKGGVTWVRSAATGLEFTKSEITVAQYRACVDWGNCTKPNDKSASEYCNWGYPDRDAHPVNCVDWNQAKSFCEWVGGRLPTEKEWEAEASNKGSREYPWGAAEVSCERAIWGDWLRTDGCGKDSTWPVCSKPRGNSVSGLCDMSGNVWEWTSSADYSVRVPRGGSWYDDKSTYLRASNRFRFTPTPRNSNCGLRCVRSSQ